MLRVSIDVQSAIEPQTGVSRYCIELASALSRVKPEHELRLFYCSIRWKSLPEKIRALWWKRFPWIPRRFLQKSWDLWKFPPYDWFAGSSDLYHFPNFISHPISQGKTVVTMHDLAFLRFPETIRQKNLSHLRRHLEGTLKNADGIITPSVFSANELKKLTGYPESQIHVVHSGLSPHFAPATKFMVTDVRQKYGIHRPFILVVGTIEPRKNLEFLIGVFERLSSFDGELIFAGPFGWNYEGISRKKDQSPRSNNIRFLSFASDADLPALYSAAELLAFPSQYEGFGFPGLEAMACGTPVVASDIDCFREVFGAAATLLPLSDDEAWKCGLQELLEPSQGHTDRVVMGLEHAKGFCWDKAANRTWNVYQRVCHGG